MIHGIDVSLYQGDIVWSQVAASGIQFAYAKATESLTYKDANFQQNHNGAKAAGIDFGAYHFFRFSTDPEGQARAFLRATDGYLGTLIPMIDIETSDGDYSLLTRIAKIATFCNFVQAQVGKMPIIYSSYGFWQDTMSGTDAFSGHPFWLAEYPYAYTEGMQPDLPTGFNHWTLWQYSSSTSVDGIIGDVDQDILNPSLTLESIKR